MWDLTSKTHIWCISGFVLKIGYYTSERWSLPLVEATRAVSSYMMFLLVERPYMHLQARKVLWESRYYCWFMEREWDRHNNTTTLDEEVQVPYPGTTSRGSLIILVMDVLGHMISRLPMRDSCSPFPGGYCSTGFLSMPMMWCCFSGPRLVTSIW